MSTFLNSLNYFRGIAIVLIVAGHCYAIAGWDIDSFGERACANLITGSTALFVFISGFLFHHLFATDFDLRRFLGKKFKDVLLPYLILSTPYIFYVVYSRGSGYHHGYVDQDWQAVIFYLATGRVIFAYWYIPFIILTFLLSPLHLRFIRCRRQLPIILLFLAVSALLHRPLDDVNTLQSVLYFTPAYLLGIWCSINRARVYRLFAGREFLLLLGAVALACLQAALHTSYGNFHKAPFAWGGIDIILFQKILLCLFFLVFLKRFEGRTIKPLGFLAKASFPIFFIHPFIIDLILTRQASQQPWPKFNFPLTVLAVTLGSILLAVAIRRLVPRYSRRIIGA
ncbi:acyltransferase [Desulfuromonas versatilis]|uniref:Acyltransferase n=1 Tax=Desulfuromonas versatilis TaxID=2802975 RepID=A0ABN6DVL8_9BACT|nr:acyltransferase [Desulfuromonas versatilis]BCR03564.1 acyltransferase [Desulfuromonas versatilis]